MRCGPPTGFYIHTGEAFVGVDGNFRMEADVCRKRARYKLVADGVGGHVAWLLCAEHALRVAMYYDDEYPYMAITKERL